MIRRRPAEGVTVSNRASRPFYRTVNRNKTINENKAIGGQQRRIVGVLLIFVSQTVVMTGLLYYFGWVRTQADFGYFGVDPSLLGYTTSDYLIRSVDSSFPLLTGLALVAFALLSLHQLVLAHAVSAPVDTPAGKILSVCVSTAPGLSFVLAAGVLLRLVFPYQIVWPRGLALPLMLVSAVGVLGYSGHLRSLRRDALGKKQKEHPSSAETRIRAILLVALGMLGVLWWITLYAAQDGEQIAVDGVANLRDEPEIFIYSSDRISIAGPGITVDPIRETESKYRYRYSGLRLLVQAGGKYILVPVGWQKGRDSVFLVPVDDTVRLDIID
jgi:hypothetical protein